MAAEWRTDPSIHERIKNAADVLTDAGFIRDVHDDEIDAALVFPNGDRYEGGLRQGQRTGEGRYIWKGGQFRSFEGEFEANDAHGTGTLVWRNGDRHEGKWRRGKAHGTGTRVWKDGETAGDRYTGEWLHGEMHGFGTYIHANGDWHKGWWHAGKAHGTGKKAWYFVDSSSRKMAAAAEASTGCSPAYRVGGTDVRHTPAASPGLYRIAAEAASQPRTLSSGQFRTSQENYYCYDGEFDMGTMQGIGKMEWRNGSKYEGKWHANMRHGTGEMWGK